MPTVLLYLSQEGKMLNNQVSALCFPCSTLPTDYDTLKQRDTVIVTKISAGYIAGGHLRAGCKLKSLPNIFPNNVYDIIWLRLWFSLKIFITILSYLQSEGGMFLLV